MLCVTPQLIAQCREQKNLVLLDNERDQFFVRVNCKSGERLGEVNFSYRAPDVCKGPSNRVPVV